MKNIHILPTDKPSRYVTNYMEQNMEWQQIYITSDEEITGFENNIWVIKGQRVFLWQNTMALVSNNKPRKIILTTDQDLIKNGVQAIDDEFLEWFVKNPNCEEVDVEHIGYVNAYNVIIPKEEEPKQETISKKLLYVQDYKSQIKALEYVIYFYEVLNLKEIVEKRDNLFKELKKLENE